MTTHEAGRALDALIAEQVMGMGSQWTVQQLADGSFVPTGGVWHDCPEFSTDIAAAWSIVEHFYNAGWGAGASMDGHTGCEASVGQFVARADTAPLAICRAALLAQEAQP